MRAGVDMNVVMSSEGRFVEVQGTGENGTFDRGELDALLDLAVQGIATLDAAQRCGAALPGAGSRAARRPRGCPRAASPAARDAKRGQAAGAAAAARRVRASQRETLDEAGIARAAGGGCARGRSTRSRRMRWRRRAGSRRCARARWCSPTIRPRGRCARRRAGRAQQALVGPARISSGRGARRGEQRGCCCERVLAGIAGARRSHGARTSARRRAVWRRAGELVAARRDAGVILATPRGAAASATIRYSGRPSSGRRSARRAARRRRAVSHRGRAVAGAAGAAASARSAWVTLTSLDQLTRSVVRYNLRRRCGA